MMKKKNEAGMTSLHMASQLGLVKVVKTLLALGAGMCMYVHAILYTHTHTQASHVHMPSQIIK